MNPRAYDVIVIGGGLVGASLALALGRNGIRTALIDAEPGEQPASTDSWDARIYAISPGSVRFLERIDAWHRIDQARAAACTSMRIYGDRAGTELEFHAYDAGVSALAHMVESRQIARALQAALAVCAGVTTIVAARCTALGVDAGAARVELASGEVLEAHLVVGADGPASWVRNCSGIASDRHDYGERGVVANFATARPHHDRAHQWFRGDSVLAWLPLPGQRVSMVWSTRTAHAQALLEMPGLQLARAVAEAGAHQLGALELIAPARAFPLVRMQVASLIAERVALVGDAAHVVHPLAGQGLNLGFGDAAVLADILGGRAQSRDCGDASLLRRYRRARAEPILAMRAMTHGLHELFGWSGGMAASVRNLGLNFVDRAPVLKGLLARHALG